MLNVDPLQHVQWVACLSKIKWAWATKWTKGDDDLVVVYLLIKPMTSTKSAICKFNPLPIVPVGYCVRKVLRASFTWCGTIPIDTDIVLVRSHV